MTIASKPTNNKANSAPAKIKVSGVILIDKPQGITSQQVVSKVKYLFKSPIHDSKKAGHTGTLDPMATGLLPVCLGEATKFSHYQLDADKSYQATLLLGCQTDTGDADGQTIAQTTVPNIDEESLNMIAQQFMGAQQQIPPMYSALKKDGKKLYEYARAGIEVDRPPRDIVIKALELQIIDAKQIQISVTCTKGTYIRVLAEDIAKALGTLGHLTSLRRTQVGKFVIDHAISLSALEALELDDRHAHLLAIDACVDIDVELALTPEQCARVHMGQRLNVIEQLSGKLKEYVSDKVSEQVATRGEIEETNIGDLSSEPLEHEVPVDIRLVDQQGSFLGLGAVSLSGRLQPKKLIQR